MAKTLQSSIVSQQGICELAGQACKGNWKAFWQLLASNPQTFLLSPPLGDIGLQLIDWLASECRQPLPLRFDEAWWPKRTSSILSRSGIHVVACMSAGDGRALLKATRRLGLREREAIARAYGIHGENPTSAVDAAVTYLTEIAAAIDDRHEDRLLMIAY